MTWAVKHPKGHERTVSEIGLSMSRSSLNDFDIISRLGSGSFGTVYKVKRIVDGFIYVIKSVRIVELSYKEQAEAINEVKLLAQMNSPFVVRYLDSFISGESLNIVMEFCNRGDLQKLLKKAKSKNVSTCLKEHVTWNICLQIMLGLHYLHKKKVLHRDLKSANVFLMTDDTQKYFSVKIGDLGVAKLLETSTAFAQTIVGTPYYLSPELCTDQPYRDKSDCWALGVLMYECCTLNHPFEARNQCALIMKIIQSPVVPPSSSSTSEGLCRIIMWLLCKDPAERPCIRDLLCEEIVQKQLLEHNFDIPSDILECPVSNHWGLPDDHDDDDDASIHASEELTTIKESVSEQTVDSDMTSTTSTLPPPPYFSPEVTSVGAANSSGDSAAAAVVANKFRGTRGAPLHTTTSALPSGTRAVTASAAAAGGGTGVLTSQSPGPVRIGSSAVVRGDRVRKGAGAGAGRRIVSERARSRYQVKPTSANPKSTLSDAKASASASSESVDEKSMKLSYEYEDESKDDVLDAKIADNRADLTADSKQSATAFNGDKHALSGKLVQPQDENECDHDDSEAAYSADDKHYEEEFEDEDKISDPKSTGDSMEQEDSKFDYNEDENTIAVNRLNRHGDAGCYDHMMERNNERDQRDENDEDDCDYTNRNVPPREEEDMVDLNEIETEFESRNRLADIVANTHSGANTQSKLEELTILSSSIRSRAIEMFGEVLFGKVYDLCVVSMNSTTPQSHDNFLKEFELIMRDYAGDHIVSIDAVWRVKVIVALDSDLKKLMSI